MGGSGQCSLFVYNMGGFGEPGTRVATMAFTSSSGWQTVNFPTQPSYSSDFFIVIALPPDVANMLGLDQALDWDNRMVVAREAGMWSKGVPGWGVDTDFMIRAIVSEPTITVTKPNGTESWTAGTSHDITWTSDGVSGNVDIELWKGGSFNSTIAGGTTNDDLYSWAIPASQAPGIDYKVRIISVSNPSLWDESNGNFSIIAPSITVTEPDGFESWATSSSHDITWTSDGVSGNVNIKLWKGGSEDSDIATGIANNGLYSWAIPASQTPGIDYKVRIISVGNPSVLDESNGDFSITEPTITVTEPDGFESWATSSSHDITWTSDGVSGNVDIELWKGGSFNSTIAGGTTNDALYSWAIPASQTPGIDYKVRIISVDNPSVLDESNGNFSITEPTITVAKPNGTEFWLRGASHDITWTSDGVSGNVDIELWKGGSFNSTIAGGTPNDDLYSWAIPVSQTPGIDYRVRIISVDNPSILDESNSDFSITAPSITVTDPDGFESWATSSSHDITWTSDGVSGNVKIELYKGGIKNSDIATNTANNGLYSWDIPASQTPGIDYKVKIISVSNPSVLDESNDDFSITEPTTIVIRPNAAGDETNLSKNGFGGSNYDRVDDVTPDDDATWVSKSWGTARDLYNLSDPTGSEAIDNIKVFARVNTVNPPESGLKICVKTGGTVYESAEISITTSYANYSNAWATNPNTGNAWTWTDINALQAGVSLKGIGMTNFTHCTQVYVEISFTSPTITVTIPNGGQTWHRGSAYDIEWASSGITGNVDIELWKDGSKNSDIVTNTANSGSYNWAIPASQAPGIDYRVRITSIDNPSILDESNSDFSITAPSITVTEPNGFESWATSSSQDITWTSDGVSGNVDIELWKGGSFNSTIASGTTNDNLYSWDIPATQAPGTDYRVRIISIDNPSILDESNGDFSITAPSITVTKPNGTESWATSSSQDITWTSDGVSGNVNIELWKGGSEDSDIATNTANSGSYNWAILASQTPGIDYKVRIISVSNPSILDESNGDFSITGSGDTATVSIPYDTVAVGSDSNIVYVNLENPIAVAGVQIVIEYDTLLTADSAKITSRSTLLSVSSSIGKDSIQVLLSPGTTSDTITSGTGYIIEIPFDVSSNAVAGDSTLLHIKKLILSDTGGNAIPFHSVDGWLYFKTGDITPPPVVTLISPPDGVYLTDSVVNFVWTSVTDPSGIDYYVLQHALDPSFSTGLIETTLVETTFTDTLSEAIYYWRVKAVDNATNEGDWSEVWSFGIDTTPPISFTLILPSNSALLSTLRPTFVWHSSSDILSGLEDYEIYIDGALRHTGTDTSWLADYDLTEDSHTWYVIAYDSAGNLQQSNETWTVTIDITSPEVPVLILPDSGSATNNLTPMFIWHSSSDATKYRIKIDGDSVEVSDTTYTPAPLSEGLHSWCVKAGDDVGNWSNYSAIWTVTIDTTLPQVTVISPDSGETCIAGTEDTIKWTATDANGIDSVSIYLSLDGGGSYPYTIAEGIPNTSPYPYTVMDTFSTECKMKVMAWDLSNNSAEDESNYDFVIAYGEKGDVKCDGEVNILDLTRTIGIIQGYGNPPTSYELWAADVKEDGEVDILDVVAIVQIIQTFTFKGSLSGYAIHRPDMKLTASDTAIVSIPDVFGAIDTDSNLVYVNLENSIGVSAVQIRITYDTLLAPHKAQVTPRSEMMTISSIIDTVNGKIQIVLYNPSLDTIASGEGAILAIPFDVSPDATPGDSILLHIEYLLLSDIGSDEIPSHPVDGWFHILETGTEITPALPKRYELSQAHPNPAMREVTISYQLPDPTEISLRIYDATGKLVKTMIETKQKAGYYSVVWDIGDNTGKQLSSGIYFYRLETPKFTATKKLIIVQ